MRTIELHGHYRSGHGTVSTTWDCLSAGHIHEFPQIETCDRGTFNVEVPYTPPNDEKYRKMAKELQLPRDDGNHISPCARITHINGHAITCRIYRGGHGGENILELLSECRLAGHLGLKPGDGVTITIEEVDEGTENMPSAPFNRADRAGGVAI
jgi:hypothetical protein